MSGRDELARDIDDVLYTDSFYGDMFRNGQSRETLIDAILAAGYRKPRTITTAEELDALQLPAIIDSPNGGVAKVEYYAGPGRQKYVEFLFCDDAGGDETYSPKFFATFGLPVVVLKEGAL
ncbi:hypothetical protein ACFVWT_04525 [Arthrobacter sp. NPDC058288]|uniref:hypothetical protein n=1 Tax=Arthrobacter sp. NPDC058288 TaxID=3346424 RepID=UPI0036E61FD0